MITRPQFNSKPEQPLGSACEGFARRKLSFRATGFAGCFCAAVFLSAAAASASAGGEVQPASGWETAEAGSWLESLSLTAAADPLNLWFVGRSNSGEGNDLLQNREGRRVLFTAQSDGQNLISRPSLFLSEKKVSSRFSYLSWASLHTGFGQFFERDTVKYSRTNGAGVDHPHWFYLKVSFRF